MENGFLIGVIATVSIISLVIFINIAKWILTLRRVVPTDQVHIVQSGKRTVSYGSKLPDGNVYYAWPSWIPKIGITVKAFKVSNFEIRLAGYKTYDSGRLPLSMDLSAFFRIENTNLAAQRVSSFDELKSQLSSILESVARAVISKYSVEDLLEARSELGDTFTKEIKGHLAEGWGVVTTKNVEIADIDDAEDSTVIHNITAKKESEIEMESRLVVAVNKKKAEEAEIEAEQSVEIRKTEAGQMVGERKVEAQRSVDLKNQAARQQVQEAARITKEKELAVAELENVKAAEINRSVKVIQAEQDRLTLQINAEARKFEMETNAEAQRIEAFKQAEAKREAELKRAEGITAVGKATAEAETAMQLAPVTAQTTLAKEIGGNKEYQQYLITVEQIKAEAQVGIEKAKALTAAKIQVIANAGDVSSGMNSASDILTGKGGTQLGMMLQGLANTPIGKQVLNTIGVNTESTNEE